MVLIQGTIKGQVITYEAGFLETIAETIAKFYDSKLHGFRSSWSASVGSFLEKYAFFGEDIELEEFDRPDYTDQWNSSMWYTRNPTIRDLNYETVSVDTLLSGPKTEFLEVQHNGKKIKVIFVYQNGDELPYLEAQVEKSAASNLVVDTGLKARTVALERNMSHSVTADEEVVIHNRIGEPVSIDLPDVFIRMYGPITPQRLEQMQKLITTYLGIPY